MAQAHLLKGIINIGCCFEELLCEHVDITLSDVMRHFVLGGLALLLQFTFSRHRLKTKQIIIGDVILCFAPHVAFCVTLHSSSS